MTPTVKVIYISKNFNFTRVLFLKTKPQYWVGFEPTTHKRLNHGQPHFVEMNSTKKRNELDLPTDKLSPHIFVWQSELPFHQLTEWYAWENISDYWLHEGMIFCDAFYHVDSQGSDRSFYQIWSRMGKSGMIKC